MYSYDFSSFGVDNGATDGMSDTSSTGGMGGMGSGTSGMGSGTSGMSGMGSGTSGMGSGGDLDALFAQTDWAPLAAVGITSFDQIFGGGAGGNPFRGENPFADETTTSASTSEDVPSYGVGEQDSLSASGGGAYNYDDSNFS